MNTGKFHNWEVIKNQITQAIKQGKCEANIQSVADYLAISRETLRDGMKREFDWGLEHLVAMKNEKQAPIVPKKTYSDVLMKGAVFDIEVTDFRAESGIDVLACCSILPLDGDIYTISITYDEVLKSPRDLRVLEETLNALSEYDLLIGHNIAAFDFNWLFTRALLYDLEMPKRWLYYDTYSAAKRITIKGRKSLDNLCAMFNLGGTKTKINRPAWMNVLSPDEAVFNSCLYGTEKNDYRDGIIYHCEQDVIANRDLFNVLYPRDRKATNIPLTTKW
jgi:DNA polymerase elongation subunit (family B)